MLKLVTAHEFYVAKKQVPKFILRSCTTDIANINRELRKQFLNHGVDNIKASYKDIKHNILIIKMGLRNTVFTFSFVLTEIETYDDSKYTKENRFIYLDSR